MCDGLEAVGSICFRGSATRQRAARDGEAPQEGKEHSADPDRRTDDRTEFLGQRLVRPSGVVLRFREPFDAGRTYVRNGSVCHLVIQPGRIEAIVSGSELYNISIRIKKLKPATWKSVKRRCSGRIGSMLELLQGRLSDQVMTVVTDRKQGLFPQPREIQLSCDCPDWAVMCKHVAAALYGGGSRLDDRPERLFLLRDVDAQELIAAELAVPAAATTGDRLDDDQLGDIFGIDLDGGGEQPPTPKTESKKRRRSRKRATSTSTKKKSRSTARRKPATAAGQSRKLKKTQRKAAIRKKPARGAPRGRA